MLVPQAAIEAIDGGKTREDKGRKPVPIMYIERASNENPRG
jgi:hypothetical protein